MVQDMWDSRHPFFNRYVVCMCGGYVFEAPPVPCACVYIMFMLVYSRRPPYLVLQGVFIYAFEVPPLPLYSIPALP